MCATSRLVTGSWCEMGLTSTASSLSVLSQLVTSSGIPFPSPVSASERAIIVFSSAVHFAYTVRGVNNGTSALLVISLI
jgi:hypothetical protein